MLLVALTYVCGMMAVPVAQVEPLAAEVQPLVTVPIAAQPVDDLEVAGQFHHHHHGHGGFGGFGGFGGGFGGFGGGFGHRHHHHHHHGLFPGLFNPFFF
jgi:hypothetical protein